MQGLLLKLGMWVLGGFIARTLVGAGLTIVGYVAFVPLLEYGLDQLNNALGGMAADVLNVLLLGGLGDIITIIGSAMMTKISLLAGLAGLARVHTQGSP
ncbi:DUF2523 family protein [Pseudoxanthomonas sp. LjRoot168]|uniref:DUF2523 family protein n=1 Tax=unclassified Pseudoxanthomonas TaxID=2645906 RepID=UPI003ECEF4CB